MAAPRDHSWRRRGACAWQCHDIVQGTPWQSVPRNSMAMPPTAMPLPWMLRTAPERPRTPKKFRQLDCDATYSHAIAKNLPWHGHYISMRSHGMSYGPSWRVTKECISDAYYGRVRTVQPERVPLTYLLRWRSSRYPTTVGLRVRGPLFTLGDETGHRVKPSLSLEVGSRYDVWSVPHEEFQPR